MKTIKYIGAQSRWPELSITGKQSVWFPGQIEERTDAEANALLATGVFDGLEVPVYFDDLGGSLSGSQVRATRAAAVVSDNLPRQSQTITATGQIVAGPCVCRRITCNGGTAVSLVLRDGVTQLAAGTDTTSPTLASFTMNTGDSFEVSARAGFGMHATVTGASASFTLEF